MKPIRLELNAIGVQLKSSSVYTGEDLNPHPERVLVSNL
jgi:hypothetical protein